MLPQYRNLVEGEKVTIPRTKNILIFSISSANLNAHIERSGREEKYVTRSNIAIVIATLERCCADRGKRNLLQGENQERFQGDGDLLIETEWTNRGLLGKELRGKHSGKI